MTDERGTFDPSQFADELRAAPANHDIGTTLWFEDDRMRVYETRLEPGQRCPFHVHDRDYFWTVVDAGRGLQRGVDGTFRIHDYALGETKSLEQSADDALIHDLENVGQQLLRFVTVEFKS